MEVWEWGYEGEHGPSHWCEAFKNCFGHEQSPIDIVTSNTVDEKIGTLNLECFNQAPKGMQLCNNGRSAQVNLDAADYVINGSGLEGNYKVVQFHFHFGHDDEKGSEHTIDGHYYPMEMHIVSYNNKYPSLKEALNDPTGLAVLGYFFKVSENTNTEFTHLVERLPEIKRPEDDHGHGDRVNIDPFPLADLLKGINMVNYYRYHGSLTTPSCAEAVVWTVYTDPILICEQQLTAFRDLRWVDGHHLEDNYRPIQPVYDRIIKHNVP